MNAKSLVEILGLDAKEVFHFSNVDANIYTVLVSYGVTSRVKTTPVSLILLDFYPNNYDTPNTTVFGPSSFPKPDTQLRFT